MRQRQGLHLVRLLLCVWCSSAGASAGLYPGDAAQGFSVPTLSGELTIDTSESTTHVPLFVVALDNTDAFSRHLWTSADSLDSLLTKAPPTSSFLFVSYERNATAAAVWMRRQLQRRAEHVLRLEPAELATRLHRMHFATEAVPDLPPPLSTVLASWTAPRKLVTAAWVPSPSYTPSRFDPGPEALGLGGSGAGAHSMHSARDQHAEVGQVEHPQHSTATNAGWWTGRGGVERSLRGMFTGKKESDPIKSWIPDVVSTRLDAAYGWIPWPLTGVEGEVVWAGWDCGWNRGSDSTQIPPSTPSLNGSIALFALSRFPADSPPGDGQIPRSDPASSPIQGATPWAAPGNGSWAGGVGAGTGRTLLTSEQPAGRQQQLPLVRPAQGEKGCSYGAMLSHAESAGARGVIFAAPEGVELREVDCKGEGEGGGEGKCPQVNIPATMVGYEEGRRLRRLMERGQGTVRVAFTEEQGPGLFAGIDDTGRLIEVGWQKFPSLMHVVWAAQWQDYVIRLRHRLAQPALVVPVARQGQVMEGEHGVRVSVDMPHPSVLLSSRHILLDLSLSCPGRWDADCPTWDHAVQLFVCCHDPATSGPGPSLPSTCHPCPTTVWGGGAASTGRDGDRGEEGVLRCGRELGRWMTPFRRRIGRWLTDVTHYRPLLASPRCTFTLQSTPWAGRWAPTLSLRLSNRTSGNLPPASPQAAPPLAWVRNGSRGGGEGDAAALAPSDVLPSKSLSDGPLRPHGGTDHLEGSPSWEPACPPATPPPPHPPLRSTLVPLPFAGGAFDARYNTRFPAFAFPTPPRTYRTYLVSLITGHGSDEHGCAEFCPSSHHFEVNGAEFSRALGEAGTTWGCADKVMEGVVPNEHGTWQYGRAGWCDGQQVTPWVVDVTRHMLPAGGGNNTVVYYGLYRGGDPHPRQQPGFIMMSAHVVTYVEEGGPHGG